MRRFIRCAAFCSLGLLGNLHSAAASEKSPTRRPVVFERDIQPIFAQRCHSCHGSKKQEVGLRLDLRRRALAGGDSGAVIIPGNSGASPLVKRIESRDDSEVMPAQGERLSETQVSLIKTWIEQGAPWPEKASAVGEAWRKHWAFQRIKRPPIPEIRNRRSVRNPVDRFVRAQLEESGIAVSPEADRATLIRRLSFDLLGLPPSPAAVEAFVADGSPNAYERLVDRLLASPHYGERWGRHWLDLARYADSNGYEGDEPRTIWPYRDWVIHALNADQPFDRFVIEQLAGDLLPRGTRAQRIATGFHCNAMLDNGVRYEQVLDQVVTTGTVFLGLTVGCAQCHSHKTDPITQREFYQLYAFFNEASSTPFLLDSPRHPGKGATRPVLAARTGTAAGAASRKVVAAALSTLAMNYAPQPTYIFRGGDPERPGDRVEPGFPAFLHQLPKVDHPTRLELARWLVSNDNPLLARVVANRVWHRFFANGLVEPENDFGVQTPAPLHLNLLDWLSSEFRDNGWSLKSIQRTIVTSATYRQSSNRRPDLETVDPRNRLLARQDRFRLEAEIIRDASLAVSGLLSHKIGGPSVFPYQPEGVLDGRATPATWKMSSGGDRYRRGMYTWLWRLTPHPMLVLFDAPDTVTACTRRDRSNTPVQALTLLNDPAFTECARALADRVVEQPHRDNRAVIEAVFRSCLARKPAAAELGILSDLLSEQLREFANSPAAARRLVGGETAGKAELTNADLSMRAAWTVVCRTLLNLDEFITRE